MSCHVTDYMAVQPDPVGAYAAPVMKHMNDDHGDSTVAMIKHYIGIDVSRTLYPSFPLSSCVMFMDD